MTKFHSPLPEKTIRRLDPGIRRAVIVLNMAGIETFESCEGGGDHAYPEPTVRFEGDEHIAMQALAAVEDAGLRPRRLSLSWSVREMHDRRDAGQATPRPFCELTFFAGTEGET